MSGDLTRLYETTVGGGLAALLAQDLARTLDGPGSTTTTGLLYGGALGLAVAVGSDGRREERARWQGRAAIAILAGATLGLLADGLADVVKARTGPAGWLQATPMVLPGLGVGLARSWTHRTWSAIPVSLAAGALALAFSAGLGGVDSARPLVGGLAVSDLTMPLLGSVVAFALAVVEPWGESSVEPRPDEATP